MARPNIFFVMLLLLVEGKNCVERSKSAVAVAAADVSGKQRDMIHVKSEIAEGGPGDEQWKYDDDSDDFEDEPEGWTHSVIQNVNEATKISRALRLAAAMTDAQESVAGFLESIEAASYLGKVMKIGSALSPLIPGYGIIFKVGNKIVNGNAELEALKKSFADIHKTSVGLDKRVQDLNKLVNSDLIYNLFSQLKKEILYISDLVNKWILASTTEDKEYFANKIIKSYKQNKDIVHLENLYNNIIGKVGLQREDMMWNINQATNCHVGTLERYGEVLLRLMMDGITNHQAYMKFTNKTDEEIEQFQNSWSDKLEAASERVNGMVRKCSVDVLHHARIEIQEVLKEKHLEEHGKLASLILRKLQGRTDFYMWLVIVYDQDHDDDVSQHGDHFFEDNYENKHVVVVFKDKDTIDNSDDLDCDLFSKTLDDKFSWLKTSPLLKAAYKIPSVSTAVVMKRKGIITAFSSPYKIKHYSNIPEKKYCSYFDPKPHRFAGWIA